VVWVAAAVGAVILALGGIVAWVQLTGGLPTSVPSCSWPLRVRGPATGEQAGLIRCYLRALARHDPAGLLVVADTTSTQVRITAAAFKHAADARAGTATATFTAAGNDSAFIVTIVFADHARATLAMVLANPASVHSWRLGIGTPVVPAGGPPAATPST
jgi:hypothetical protein